MIQNIQEQDIQSAALAPNTRKAYDRCWLEFSLYCKKHHIDPLNASPDNIANYFIWIANQPRPKSTKGKYLTVNTINQIKSAIYRKYKDNDKLSPTKSAKVTQVLTGLARIKGRTPKRAKALTDNYLKKILARIDYDIRRFAQMPETKQKNTRWTHIQRAAKLYRDASCLSLGFAAALRVSELVAVKLEHIDFIPDSNRMILTIPKSKTDQESKGQFVPIIDGQFIQPIKRLKDWLNTHNITSGYVFRTLNKNGSLNTKHMHITDIPRIIKSYVTMIGLNPTHFSGHSLRAGFVTSAAIHDASIHKIMEITRHTSTDTVMKYIRDANAFKNHAANKFM